MDITSTPVPAPATRHRTLVALPLFAVLLIGTMMQGAIVRGDVIGVSGLFTTKEERTVLPLQTGGHAVLMPGAEATIDTEVTLSDGEMMISDASLVSLRAGAFTVQGWHGAFGASVDEDSVTVVALTTPVLLSSGEQHMIVPVGTQARVSTPLPALAAGAEAWTAARTVLPLPTHYVRERLEMLQDLPQPAVAVHPTEGDWSLPTVLDSVRLPSARERSAQELNEQKVGELFAALRMGDAERIQTSMLDADLQAYLSSGTEASLMPDVIALSMQSNFMPLFLPLALRDESFRLIASSHPDIRDYAWVTTVEGELSPEARMTLLFSVPRADLLPESLSSLSVQRWKDEVTTLVQSQGASKGPLTLDAFVPRWTEAVAAQADANLPERVQRYASVIAEVSAPYADRLSSSTLVSLGELERIPQELSGVRFEEDGFAESETSSSVSSHAASSSALEGEAGPQAAIDALRAAGGMETPHTAISPTGPHAVHVVNMVFATDAGDLPFEFGYDASTDQVSDILKDGKVLPYAVPLEQFVVWIKKGMK